MPQIAESFLMAHPAATTTQPVEETAVNVEPVLDEPLSFSPLAGAVETYLFAGESTPPQNDLGPAESSAAIAMALFDNAVFPVTETATVLEPVVNEPGPFNPLEQGEPPPPPLDALGQSDGVATVGATAQKLTGAIGQSDGVATVSGTAYVVPGAFGQSDGVATVSGTAYVIEYTGAGCDCPGDGYAPIPTEVVAIDYINGYPASYGEFTANIDDFGIDTGDSEDELLRELLNLPGAGGDTYGNIEVLFTCGSGIKVEPSDPNYYLWEGFRLDCGCLAYDCGVGGGVSGEILLPCALSEFVDEDGYFDYDCDKIVTFPRLKLDESFGVGDGTRLDGSIPNLMFFDPSIEHAISTYNGIPVDGRFDNYTDPYGIVYSAEWLISGATVDITTTIKDPRILGQAEEEGRIVQSGKTIRVVKRGTISTIRQIIRVVDEGYVILFQDAKSEEGEFQATFGCGDNVSGDPFFYHTDTSVLDQVEFEGGSNLVQDPEDDTTPFEWWPQLLTDGSGNVTGFQLYDSGYHGPISSG